MKIFYSAAMHCDLASSFSGTIDISKVKKSTYLFQMFNTLKNDLNTSKWFNAVFEVLQISVKIFTQITNIPNTVKYVS